MWVSVDVCVSDRDGEREKARVTAFLFSTMLHSRMLAQAKWKNHRQQQQNEHADIEQMEKTADFSYCALCVAWMFVVVD